MKRGDHAGGLPHVVRNEAARGYLDGKLDAAAARQFMQRTWLITPDAAAKTLRFIETYRSYVINYNLGRDLVAEWVQRTGGDSEEARWRAFGTLLSRPHLPRDLQMSHVTLSGAKGAMLEMAPCTSFRVTNGRRSR